MHSALSILIAALAGTAQLATAHPTDLSAASQKRCVATISSIADVAAAKACTTININSFTVPAKQGIDLSGLLTGTQINLNGDLTFTAANWDGPLLTIDGTNVAFQGNGHTLDGQGAKVWDSLGSNDGASTKALFVKLKHSGSFTNVNVKNSPRQVFSVGNKAALLISKVNIDNSAGNAILASTGKPAAHNTDGFDVSSTDTTISGCTVNNQDDCLAMNAGSGLIFTGNTCIGGHGISIGSIASGKTVSNVKITGNTVKSSDNGIRIKTIYGATGASVSDVTYTGNTISGISKYGVVIEQDYENGGPTGTATNGVSISNINFTGAKTSVSVGSNAQAVYVLCGSNSCKGTWDWSSLTVSGGKKSTISPSSVPIKNFSV